MSCYTLDGRPSDSCKMRTLFTVKELENVHSICIIGETHPTKTNFIVNQRLERIDFSGVD
ncbi:MAG: hypothetical protein ACTSPQ_15070 [Candidatus Helarchaeota archaeon]